MIASTAECSLRWWRRKMGRWLMVNDRSLWMDALLMKRLEYCKKHRKITRRTFAFDEQCVWGTLNVQQQVNSGRIASNDWCVVNVCCQKKEKKKKKEIFSLHGNYTVHLERAPVQIYFSPSFEAILLVFLNVLYWEKVVKVIRSFLTKLKEINRGRRRSKNSGLLLQIGGNTIHRVKSTRNFLAQIANRQIGVSKFWHRTSSDWFKFNIILAN